MRHGVVAFSALTFLGLALTACGINRYAQREPWRTQAEQACLAQKLVQPSAYMSRISPIQGAGICGMDYPFRISAFAGGSVGLTRNATLACPVIPRIDGWLNDVVQPAAALYFGTSVAEVRSGSYSCRSRNNQRGARYSEHSFGNALDVMAFRLADGREVSISRGWRGAPEEQEFLREVFVGACGYFTTVLGPGADMFHHDHFHLDLARHDPRGERRICKPVLKFEPRLGGDVARPIRKPTPESLRAPPQQPVDIEEDDDPFAVSKGPARPPAPPARPPTQTYASAAPPPRSPAQTEYRAAGAPRAAENALPASRMPVGRPPAGSVGPLARQARPWTGEGIY